MTILHRDDFLNNVARNLGRKRRNKHVERPNWSVSPQYDILKNCSQDELITVLKEQCTKIHTDFEQIDCAGLPLVLKTTIEKYRGKSIVAANDRRNEQYHLTDFYQKLQKDGYDIHLWNEKDGKANQLFAERADIGISFSDITLAESGTVTLFIDKYHGRSISLMPKAYIAIIPKSTVVPRMTQATKAIHEKQQHGEVVPSCVSFVTGPSNSADIEMNLIVGVHGPIHVTYIVVTDA